jgi:serine protease
VRSTVPMGKGSEESLTVSGVRYEAIAMEGSPNLTRSGALANCGKALTTCTAASGGRVCLIERGDISFADKVLNCQAGGGTAAVIYNNAPGLFSGTVSGAGTSIPSVGISQEHGQWLLANGIGAASSVAVGPGNYAYYDGTSMAAPHVAGVAALVWSHNPGWSVGQVRQALQATAKDLGAAGKDNAYGYGLVKAADALAHLNGGTPPPPPPPPPNQPPTASFTYSCSGLTCSFDGSGSTDGDGTIASYAWNFGDGTAGTGVNATRSYAAGGTYTVILTVTDNGGLTGTTSQSVTVTAPATGGISLTANAYKVQGLQKVDLSWNGATTSSVEIFRSGVNVATPANSGAYTDHINVRGGGTYTYRVCEAGAGTSTCSPDVNVSF